MASEIFKRLQCTAQKSAQPNKLDSIANYMDSILNNMKCEVKNSKKNKNIESQLYNPKSGFQNFPGSPLSSAHQHHSKSVPFKTSEAINKYQNKIMAPSHKSKSTTSKSGSTTSSKKSTTNKNHAKNLHFTKAINKAHTKTNPGKTQIVNEVNKHIRSLTCVAGPTHPKVVSMGKNAVVFKGAKKSITRLNKQPGNINIGQNNKTVKTIIQETLSKVIAPLNKKENIEKKIRKIDNLRPMSVEAKQELINDNKRRTVSYNNREQMAVNQKPKSPNKKKLLMPCRSPPVEHHPIIRPKPEELKHNPIKKSEYATDILDAELRHAHAQEITVATAFINNPGPSKNFNILLNAIPVTSEGKAIKFMKNNSDNKTKPEQKVETTPVPVPIPVRVPLPVSVPLPVPVPIPVPDNTKKGECNEMGDNSLKIINEKLQDIFNRIREEKDITTHSIKNCMIEKFGTPVLISTEQKLAAAAKPVSNNNNNNNTNNTNVNNNAVNDSNKNTNAINNNNTNIKQNVVKTDITTVKQPVKTDSNNNNKQNLVVKPEINNNKQNMVVKQEYNNNKQNFVVKAENNNKQTNNDNMKIAVQSVPFPTTNKKLSNMSCNLKQSLQSGINRKASNNLTSVPIPRKFSTATPMEIIQEYVVLVNRAKRDRKTYTVCGNYFSIRRAFIERGWLEKIRINVMDEKDNYKKLESLSNFELVEQMRNGENGEKCKRIFISKLLAGHQVDFYWDYQTNPFNVNSDKIKKTIINRFPFSATRSYTSKAGLCDSLKEAYWYYIDGYSNILFPRTYNLAFDEELTMFIDDFRITAAISLLSWVNKNAEKPLSIISPNGTIPVSVFNFATLQCYNYIKSKEHKDLDSTIAIARESEWDIFLEKFYKIIHQGQHFKESDLINAPLLLDQAKYILGKIKRYIPYLLSDGNMNLWLLKPNNGSRGCGIHVCRTLKYALDTVQQRKDVKYVIQKYIEKPLLIHNTKFDIRQWFLVTCMPTIQVWLYKDNYLRFSTQMYDLSKLHESIHLTNNSIQCRYRNNANRSNALPEQNMWHSDTFRKYLSDIGQPYAWRNIIYKGIKECLVGLFMLCQDKITTRINSFELCGADFMLAEDYRPYLIEINSRPALYSSTRVTAQMCPRVLEDVVKVTVDYQRNQKASTGNFELIYKDNFHVGPQKELNAMMIEGFSYAKLKQQFVKQNPQPIEVSVKRKKSEELTGTHIKQILNIDPNKVRKEVKTTLEKILAMIHSEQSQKERADNDEKHLQFRKMLSEFVDIISGLKT